MTIEQLRKMIERRGYTVFFPPPERSHPAYKEFYIQRGDAYVIWAVSYLTLAQSRADVWLTIVEQRLAALSGGHHHIQCICGLPLLQTVDTYTETSTWLEYQGEQYPVTPDGYIVPLPLGPYTEREYDYRLVSAGPDSEPIKTCPQCSATLAESVKEIEDGPGH